MNAKTQQALLHIAGWMVFLSLPLLFSPESLSLHAYLTNPPTRRDLISYVLVLAVFYLNFYWLIPKLYFRRRYLSFFLVGILCFIPIVFLPRYLISPGQDPGHRPPGTLFDPQGRDHSPNPSSDPYPGPPPDAPPAAPGAPSDIHDHPDPSFSDHPPGVPPRPSPGHIPSPSLFMDIGQHLFLFLGMIFLALMLKIRGRWKQTEKEVLQTELAYLKAQINPHFLFNSLNGIYALALEKSDQAPAAIVKLSEMMRYVLDDTGKEWVSLEKEIAYIRNYIALQETRFGSSIHLDFQVIIHPAREGAPGDAKIAPLILIPFIENTFKHGVNAEEDSDIHIRIELKEKELHLLVINKKVTVNQPTASHSGLGIDNTKRRLLLLYPRSHTLDIHDNTHDFQVSLTLKLI